MTSKKDYSFSEEKEAKSLLSLDDGLSVTVLSRIQTDKSLFASFSSEKEESSFLLDRRP